MAQIWCFCDCGGGWQAAVALIRFLAWDYPYAKGVALKKKKRERERSSHRDAVVNESDWEP